MIPTRRLLPVLLALATACAGAAPAPAGAAADPQRYKQADYKYPPESRNFDDDIERGFFANVLTHSQAAAIAAGAGNLDQARTEWAAEARSLVEFCEKFPSSEFRVSFRFQAAKRFWYAQQGEAAAEQAEKAALDPAATKATRAAASYLGAVAWLNTGYAKAKAGTLEKLVLLTPEQRRDKPLAPRVPPGEWKRFVLSADAYAEVADADPDRNKPLNERLASVPPQTLALQAAQVQFAFDNMEDARGRLDRIIQTWPGEADVMEAAVPLYLMTFAVLKDPAGEVAALAKVKEAVSGPAAKATDPKAKEGFAKVLDLIAKQEAGAQVGTAQRLLDGGKPAEAAEAFEKLVAGNPTSPDAALALYNGAIAWEKAGQPEKAAAVRERLVRDYSDERVVPAAMLTLAGARSKAKNHEGARALYADYLAKYPDGQFRCGARQNLGVELEALKRPLDAAAEYQAYGADGRCAGEDYNATAKLLFRAAELFEKGGKKPQAKETYGMVAKLSGMVTDVVSKSLVNDSKKRMKGL